MKEEEKKRLRIGYKKGSVALNRTKFNLLRIHTGRTMNNYRMVSRLGITEQYNHSESELRILGEIFLKTFRGQSGGQSLVF